MYRPTPGSDSPGGRVKGDELKRLIHGNVLEAYSTEMFGRDVNRSDSSAAMLRRLAVLNRKSLRGKLSGRDFFSPAHPFPRTRATLPDNSPRFVR